MAKNRLGFCEHKWQIINRIKLTNMLTDGDRIVYIQECSKCGKLKRFEAY